MSDTDSGTENKSLEDQPTSFGVFKPIGWVMVGVPALAQALALEKALLQAGWPAEEVLHFRPGESVDELQALVDDAGALAGFGYEITMLRRYLALARQGYQWLLVKAQDSDQAAAAARLAAAGGATLAVHYRRLVVEDLISPGDGSKS
jgi:hypothetical protein